MAAKKFTLLLLLALSSPAMACSQRMADTLLIKGKPIAVDVWMAEGVLYQRWWYAKFYRTFKWSPADCLVVDAKNDTKRS